MEGYTQYGSNISIKEVSMPIQRKGTEAQARIKINKLLEKAGWRLIEDQGTPANVQLETNIQISQQQRQSSKIKKPSSKEKIQTSQAKNKSTASSKVKNQHIQTEMEALGNDFEKTTKGFVDYLLLDEQGYPLAVLEAKREEKNPLDGKEQARKYANSQNIRFVILSNGNLHYFWDLQTGNPEIILEFPKQKHLKSRLQFKPDPQKLHEALIDEDYIATTQDYNVVQFSDWSQKKQELSQKYNLKILRDYQVRAIQALQGALRDGKQRFLLEMATGTGKTLLSAAIIKLFLKTGNAKRVLFLVDRLELEQQAYKNFQEYLSKDYTTYIYKEHKDNWNKAEIVISTIQSLWNADRYKKAFSPTDFDLLISDEAHRSIGGNSRAVFEYFIGYKLGLTATPKDYLKNIDALELSEKDQRKWEKRLLLDTYNTFGCEQGEPTFKYSLMDGVRDGYLINPIAVDARTEITTQLLSDKGYSVRMENTEGEEEEKVFYHTAFEKKFFSEKTNFVFCKNFLERALKDPITDEMGKSIVFCVSQQHASKITQMLNKMAHQKWPDKYNSDFAVQVTSNIGDCQQRTVHFANNKLNGYSKFLEGYKTSKTRVCVTVGMMTTGYDCQDILNLCLMRPVFSPTLFVQMKGRGTRKFTFKYEDKNGRKHQFEKEKFKLFDYFANCEFFEEKFNYDEPLNLPQQISDMEQQKFQEGEIIKKLINEIEVFDPDAIASHSETQITNGMKVDRELWGQAREEFSKDQELKKAVEQERWDRAEQIARDRYENKPELYLTLDKIKRAENLDRRVTWKEVLQRVFCQIDRFKTRDELLNDECDKFISIYKPENQYFKPIKNYLRAYINFENFRKIIDDKNYNELYHSSVFSMEDFKALNGNTDWQNKVPEYVKNYVRLNTFIK